MQKLNYMTLQFQKYTDNGSDTSYKLTKSSPLIVHILWYFGLYEQISRTGSSLQIQQAWLYSERNQNNITSLYLEREQVAFSWISRSQNMIHSW